MAKAWELDLSQGEKLVLLALCDHANDDGICYPS
ncbi:helix-turn-helix domain-containing protein [Snodgrassella alvi]